MMMRMTKKVSSAGKAALVRQIEKHLGDANRLSSGWDSSDGKIDPEEKERAESLIESAFEGALVLAEMLELPDMRERVRETYERAKRNLIETKYSEAMGELYLVWSYKLDLIVSSAAVACSPAGAAAAFDREAVGMPQVEQLLDRFHGVALELRTRRVHRAPLRMRDEYDVQYLLRALLHTRFVDVRPEEWTPSYAGRSSRMDFLLKDEKIVIEAKRTRAGLGDGDVGDQLILDIARYKKHRNCRTLVCFVYDPDHRLKRPAQLERDLSGERDGLQVRVRVRPSR